MPCHDKKKAMAPTLDSPETSLNEVLSEVIDIVQEVKQAHRKVPETHALHAVLDQLFEDLRGWAQLLMDRDDALGLSPLSSMTSVAGRKPTNLWPGAATDEEVCSLVDEHLGRLGQHVSVALAEQVEEPSRRVLAGIEEGLLVHRSRLAGLP